MKPFFFITAKTGNYFFKEIGDFFEESLNALGRPAYSLSLSNVSDLPVHASNIIVAPHEFFFFNDSVGKEYILAERNCSVLVTERCDGPYWPASLEAAYFASAVFDLDPNSVEQLCSRGIDARLILLGYNPNYDYSRPGLPRDQDVFFAGNSLLGPRPEIIAQICERLPPERRWIHIQDEPLPIRRGEKRDFVFGPNRARQIAQTKIGLDIIWTSLPYLDQFRYFLQYVTNGALIFTNRLEPIDLLEPGVDFVFAPTEQYIDVLFEWLDQPRRIAELAAKAREKFISERPIQRTLAWLVDSDLPVTMPSRRMFVFDFSVPPPPSKHCAKSIRKAKLLYVLRWMKRRFIRLINALAGLLLNRI